MVCLVFSSAVNAFLGFLAFVFFTLGFLALGFAVVFFLTGFAFDLAFGNAFGVVLLGAGFLAAFVAEVVAPPVLALDRGTTFCA